MCPLMFSSRISVKRTIFSIFCSHFNIIALVKSTVQDASLSLGKAVRCGIREVEGSAYRVLVG